MKEEESQPLGDAKEDKKEAFHRMRLIFNNLSNLNEIDDHTFNELS